MHALPNFSGIIPKGRCFYLSIGFGQAESPCSAKLFGRICLEPESILLTGALGCLGGISSLGSGGGARGYPLVAEHQSQDQLGW